jgi:acyl-CoA thioesterase
LIHPNRDKLQTLFEADIFAAGLGFELAEWEGGRSVMRWTPTPAHHNMLSGVHGGAIFSLGDSAFGIACNSWGRVCLALSIEVHYLIAPAGGEPVVAVATERARTRRTCSAQVDIAAEDSGVLVASFQAMGYRTHRWHFGEDVWPSDWREQY